MSNSNARTASSSTLSGDESLDLPGFDLPPKDPFEVLHAWLAVARNHGVREPLAVSLATAVEQGRASSRMVLVKEVLDDAHDVRRRVIARVHRRVERCGRRRHGGATAIVPRSIAQASDCSIGVADGVAFDSEVINAVVEG